jgi:hypothetical protein
LCGLLCDSLFLPFGYTSSSTSSSSTTGCHHSSLPSKYPFLYGTAFIAVCPNFFLTMASYATGEKETGDTVIIIKRKMTVISAHMSFDVTTSSIVL